MSRNRHSQESMYSPMEQRYGGPVGGNGVSQQSLGNGRGSRDYQRNGSTSAASGRKPSMPGPNGSIILEGYRDELTNGFEGDKPRYNAVSKFASGTK